VLASQPTEPGRDVATCLTCVTLAYSVALELVRSRNVLNPWQANVVDGDQLVVSQRHAARLLDMRPSSIFYWRRSGKLGPAPWMLSELLAVKHRTDAPPRRRGIKAAHGTSSRVGAAATAQNVGPQAPTSRGSGSGCRLKDTSRPTNVRRCLRCFFRVRLSKTLLPKLASALTRCGAVPSPTRRGATSYRPRLTQRDPLTSTTAVSRPTASAAAAASAAPRAESRSR
jgi:hypothetical protein